MARRAGGSADCSPSNSNTMVTGKPSRLAAPTSATQVALPGRRPVNCSDERDHRPLTKRQAHL
jgi:hypothetical protein